MVQTLVPVKPRSIADIELFTLNIIKKYQPGVLDNEERFDIENYFECHLEKITGVTTDYQKLGNGIYGFTDSEEMISVISIDLIEDTSQEYFCRSTMAHETAHATYHVSDHKKAKAYMKLIHNKAHSLKLYRVNDIKPFMNPEWQAWKFAGSLLMPAPVMRDAIKRKLSIQDISKRFGVNPAFAESRIKALEKTKIQQ